MAGGKSKSSILLYGVSGVGKTTQIGELAQYVHSKEGRITRLVSASGGGWGVLDPHIEAGLISPTFIVNRPGTFGTMHKLSQGYWPADPDDPRSPLIPPDKQKDFEQVGAIAFDSASEIAETMMRQAIENEASGRWRISGQQAAAKFTDEGEAFGASSMGMYGTIQNYIAQFVSKSKAIADLYVMWTALETKVTDENTRLPVYGPTIIGVAKTTWAPAWFDNCLHLYFENVQQQEERRSRRRQDGQGERRLYLTRHFEDGVPFLAKNTASKYAPLPEYLEGNDLSLGKFLALLEESKTKVKDYLKKGGK